MRTLVLYTSKTGAAQKYAEDIAKRVGGDVFPLKKFKAKKYAEYDTIVFGGWVMGNVIQGLNDFLAEYDRMEDKNVIVFSSGMSMPTKEGRQAIIDANVLDMYHIRYYQLRGDFDYSKLPFYLRLVMDNSLRMIAKDENATADQRALSTIKNNPIVYYDQEKVDRIVTVINGLSVLEAQVEEKQ